MHLLSGGFTPVAEVRHGKSSCVLDQRGNQHGLVSRQHSLADRNLLAALILRAHGTRAVLAIRLIGERLLDLTVLVAIETAILAHAALSGSSRWNETTQWKTHHGLGVRIRGRFGVPLHGYLAWGTSVRAVIARLAGLIGAHSPSGVLHVRSHSD